MIKHQSNKEYKDIYDGLFVKVLKKARHYKEFLAQSEDIEKQPLNKQKVWNLVMAKLMENGVVEKEIVNHFYSRCRLLEISDCDAIIEAPNIVTWQIVSNQKKDLRNAFMAVIGKHDSFHIEIKFENEEGSVNLNCRVED